MNYHEFDSKKMYRQIDYALCSQYYTIMYIHTICEQVYLLIAQLLSLVQPASWHSGCLYYMFQHSVHDFIPIATKLGPRQFKNLPGSYIICGSIKQPVFLLLKPTASCTKPINSQSNSSQINCQHAYIGGNQIAIHVWRHTKAYTQLFIEYKST